MSSPTFNTAHQQRRLSLDDADDDEEVWSDDEQGDDGARKRKRARYGEGSRPMSVSCELCKQRKVKCDRGQPQCGWCVRNNQICEYRERKKPGLRAGYGRELESRLDKLEGVLQTQQTLLQQLASHLPGSLASAQALSSPASHRSQSTVQHAEGAVFMPTPTSYPPSGFPGPATDDSRHQTTGSVIPQTGYVAQASTSSLNLPAGQSPAGRISEGYAASNPAIQSPGLNVHNDALDPAIDRNGSINVMSRDHGFPPYDLLYSCTDLFFKHINTWCPILHRRTTLDALFGSSTLEEADRILLHAIVATTLRFSSDPRLTESTRELYHSTSKQKVLLYGLENSSVKALQALVILTLDTLGSSNGPPGWNLLAIMARSVVQLGLAVEATSSSVAPIYPSIYTLRAITLPEPRNFIEDESRRRLFWIIYVLDRYATIATAFEFALDEKEIDRKLPCRDDLFSRNQHVNTRWFRPLDHVDYSTAANENLGSFSYYIEIIGILSQVHQFLKRPIDISALSDVEQWQRDYRHLDNRLSAWKFGLPDEYRDHGRIFLPNGGNKIVNCVWIMLHVTYHTTVIRLHSSAAYPTTRSPIFTPSYAASQRCLTAVEDLCSLNSYVRSNNLLNKLGPPFAFSLWVAARLLLVHGSTIDHHVNPAIGPLVETLRELGSYWKVAERYATLLQRVLDEYHESAQVPSGVRETPSTVRILADMRRTAFDLDFLISRQPRHLFAGAGVDPFVYARIGGNAAAGGGLLGPSSGTETSSAAAAGAGTTLARTPGPNELEYLDVFDFFNMPRLPLQMGSEMAGGLQQQQQGQVDGANGEQGVHAFAQPGSIDGMGINNEFNITNFTYDANADWLGDNGK